MRDNDPRDLLPMIHDHEHELYERRRAFDALARRSKHEEAPMTTANSEQFAHQAAMHATEARIALGRAEPDFVDDESNHEHQRFVAQVEMQHALVCAVLALRDTIREGHA